MKNHMVLLALGAAVLGCGSDPTSASNANPDPDACGKGSISVGDVKSGTLNGASCLRYDYAYSEDSVYYDSYSFRTEKGKGYMFLLENSDGITNWDALLELATVDPSSGNQQLLALSDDEGGHGWSRLYFIAPTSGTYHLRASGYDKSDTASYKLTAKSCDSPLPLITGALAQTTQTLSASDCVLAQPEFFDDSTHIKLYSIALTPNQTKTITVTSNDFPAGFQVFGPAWGVDCNYAYEGCGGGVSNVTKGDPESITIHGSGDQECNDAFHAPDHRGPSASLHSASINICENFDWPGTYTLTVGSFFAGAGTFTLSVTQDEAPVRVVGPDAPSRNPTLNFLRKKPLRSSDYLSRAH